MRQTTSRPVEWRDIDTLIGITPLVDVASAFGLPGTLLAKCEFMRPTGSHKVWAYAQMLMEVEKSGRLIPGMEVVDYTTGNGAAAMAWLCSLRGHSCTAVMPDGLPEARYEQAQRFGARIVRSPGPGTNIAASRAFAAEYIRESPGSRLLLSQSENPANVRGFERLGKEVRSQLRGYRISSFVCGYGTGGALTGVCRTLRQRFSSLRMIGVDIDISQSSFHGVIGYSPNAKPPILDASLIDESATITEAEAREWAERIRSRTGHWVGTSSGASVGVAARLLESRPELSPCLVILWDNGSKYV